MTSRAPGIERAASRPPAPFGAAEIPPWATALVRLLDGALVIPGTRIGIGLDAILGFFAPGAGDAAGAIATAALLVVAVRARVPKVIVARMLLNVLVDALIGAVPLVGDVFDVAFRAASKNLALVRAYAGTGKAPGALDYAVLGLSLLCVLALVALPVVIGLAALHALARFSGG